MNQTHRILPVYTSDVSGVCSALYELGGLIVMHDPSGCNSTYNTHDEIRWYEKDSLIFISGLTERDAVMGNDEKFYSDVLETAMELKPEFIAVTNSPIPYLTGTDFPAITKKLENELKIPCFYVPANGMHDYTMGAGKAFAKAAGRLVNEKYDKPIKRSVNILGMTPLDYAAKQSSEGIRRVLENAGFKVNSIWAMDECLDNISRSGEAAVNLVVSSTGLYAAKKLKERFDTPYVIGTPVGEFTQVLIRELETAQKTGTNIAAYLKPDTFLRTVSGSTKNPDAQAADSRSTQNNSEFRIPDSELTLVGEPVIMGSLAAAIRLKYGTWTKVLCPTEICKGLLCENDIKVYGEEETQEQLKKAKKVTADPFYRYICPEDAVFYPLPHLAMSGRIYLKEMKSLQELEI